MMNDRALARLDRIAREQGADRAFEALRESSLEEVGELLLQVPERWPALRGALPEMPPDDVQIGWTGASGAALLAQSLSFVREVAGAFRALAGRPLDGARILDYGCGWGRLIRLMYKFSSPDRIWGCDAWESSLALCGRYRVRAHLAPCDEVPTGAPFPGVTFELVYAFSVLTHLSERTAKAVMGALRRSVARDGLCAVTVRPVEYWDYHPQQQNAVDVARMKRDHARSGFAFTPHNRPPVGGEVTYGDASISLDYIARNWTEWSVAGDRACAADPLQRIVFLRPA